MHKTKETFSKKLRLWNNGNTREMPWKGEKDAYKIWLSEIILQQTRVQQGMAYYECFLKHYPTIIHLANANDTEVFKLWEGLGYYTRCKNLLITARYIRDNGKGVFPNTYESILALKGVGPYTAAAIASFAYNLPYAVVDGNVFRVLARVFNNNTAIDSIVGKKYFAQLANELLDKKQPAIYNQAIMDFGATICTPALPKCGICSLNTICEAFTQNTQLQLPVKEKRLVKKNRFFSYFIFRLRNTTWINKRGAGDVWENLHEYYLVENDEKQVWNNLLVKDFLYNNLQITDVTINAISNNYKQQLTHQTIHIQFIDIELKIVPSSLPNYWIENTLITTLAFPKTLVLHQRNNY